jgi:hypothetical protein
VFEWVLVFGRLNQGRGVISIRSLYGDGEDIGILLIAPVKLSIVPHIKSRRYLTRISLATSGISSASRG